VVHKIKLLQIRYMIFHYLTAFTNHARIIRIAHNSLSTNERLFRMEIDLFLYK